MDDVKVEPAQPGASTSERFSESTIASKQLAESGSNRRTTLSRTTLSITSQDLFAGATEVQIEHRGALYRLQQTSLGKLILTK